LFSERKRPLPNRTYDSLDECGVMYEILIPAQDSQDWRLPRSCSGPRKAQPQATGVRYKSFAYQAGSWTKPGRIVAKVKHRTDRKIRIHAFYCMLGISLLQYVHRQAKAAWSDLSMEQLIEELQHIQQFILLYPRQGEKGPDRAAYVLSKQTLAQQALAKALKLDELQITHRG
jgi:hypothetical protein